MYTYKTYISNCKVKYNQREKNKSKMKPVELKLFASVKYN